MLPKHVVLVLIRSRQAKPSDGNQDTTVASMPAETTWPAQRGKKTTVTTQASTVKQDRKCDYRGGIQTNEIDAGADSKLSSGDDGLDNDFIDEISIFGSGSNSAWLTKEPFWERPEVSGRKEMNPLPPVMTTPPFQPPTSIQPQDQPSDTTNKLGHSLPIPKIIIHHLPPTQSY